MGDNEKEVKNKNKIDDEKDIKADDEKDIEMEIIEIEKKPKKKKKVSIYDVVRCAVMLMSLCLFSYASYELTLIYISGQETDEASAQVSDLLSVQLDDNNIDYYNANGEKIELVNSGDGTAFVWDFEKIKTYNPNAKGYIRQGSGTYIDNPIVQHPSDNDYYLEHLSNNYPSGVGSIFIDYRITEGLNARNCILYGHNVKAWANYIMFGSLNFYYDNPEYGAANPTIDIYVDEHHYVYYVFAIYKVEAIGSPVYKWSFESDEEFLEYANECKASTQYDFPQAPEITADSHLLTLSTCTTVHEQRMIVQLVRGEEIFDVPVDSEGME